MTSNMLGFTLLTSSLRNYLQAGISREAFYRSLSPKGNPTLKTLLAVLKFVGMRLSVEPDNHVHA
jgi:probable addiction module antidote protein